MRALFALLLPIVILAWPHMGAAQLDAHDEEHAGMEKAAQDTTSQAEESDEWDVATSTLAASETEAWTVDEGTWMSLDVSPDGSTIVFDLLGDLFTLPMAGGQATLLRGGRAYDVQPRYSPDGQWISFTSDGGGGDNVWVMRADGSQARAVTDESFRLLNNAAWMPDGSALVARKHFTSGRSLGAGEMWLYDVNSGGSGVQLTEKPNDQKDVGEPEVSPDGRYLYYSLDSTPGSRFEYNKDPNDTIYEIRRLDLDEGRTETVVSEAGGSVRPEISPDGKHLAFVRRVRLKSVLMVRDLQTGEDRVLFDGLSLDSQETWAIFGVYPGFAWTPDGGSIVIWAEGKIMRVDVATGAAREIPFEANLEHDVVQALRFPQDVGESDMDVKVLRWHRVSPDGKTVVFQALGHLWVRPVEAGTPRRLTDGSDFEFHPAWSNDGRSLVYTTWNDKTGGRVRTVRANGGAGRVVVDTPGHYSEPSFSSDGTEIVYRRGGGDFYRGRAYTGEEGIYVVGAKGGQPTRVTRDGSRPRFFEDDQRILLFERGSTKTLYSVNRMGGDRRDLATSERAMEITLSPDGRWLAFEELWQVYVTRRPAAGRAIAVGPSMGNLPVHKVSDVAGEFLDWSPDSRHLRFGLAAELRVIDVEPLFAYQEPEDENEDEDSKVEEDDEAEEDDEEEDEPSLVEQNTQVVDLGFKHPRDTPNTNVLLTGATVITMEGDTVIENGWVRVRGNEIVAVGPVSNNSEGSGIVDIRGDLQSIDVSGKFIVPGYIDTHAHMGSSNSDMHAQNNWAYMANLAFGVTTTHDPSNNTRMVFASHELVEAGKTVGPRVYSTGTILYGAEGDFKAPIDSRDDAQRHLKRLKAYGAFSCKSYNQPRRNQRQWVIREAHDLEMMVMPEGGSTLNHNLTMFLDGHSTLEHPLPIAPFYDDIRGLVLASGTAYTPTLIVGYGGIWGENYWYQKTNVWENERLMNFVPRSVVDPRSRRRIMAPDDDFHHVKLAAGAASLVRGGGVATVGAHGQLQGLGVHWEMWMYAQGGLSPLEVLRVGTLHGATAIGMDHRLGSIETGKLADLLVLDRDPRKDIRNTESVAMVMSNGRLYDARTMDQLAPEATPRPVGPSFESIPRGLWGVDCQAFATEVTP